jgi:hypothetical protein
VWPFEPIHRAVTSTGIIVTNWYPYYSRYLDCVALRSHCAALRGTTCCHVILDGVWRMSGVRNLLGDGEKDRLLIATRDYGVVSRLGMEREAIRVVIMN